MSIVFVEYHSDGGKIVCVKQVRDGRSVKYVCQCKKLMFRAEFSAYFCDLRCTKLYGKLYATRRRGRPKMRWLEDVSMDLRKMGVNEWRDRARKREAWRHILEEAKAHPRL